MSYLIAEVFDLKIGKEKIRLDMAVELAAIDTAQRILIANTYLTKTIRHLKSLEYEQKEERGKFYTSQLKKDSKQPEWKLKIQWNLSNNCKLYNEAHLQVEFTIRIFISLLDALHSKIGVTYHPTFLFPIF